MKKLAFLAAACFGAILATPASAQVAMHGTIVTVPIVVQSGTYGSAVFIHNPNFVPINISVAYVGGDGSATPGLTGCPVLNVPANTTLQRSLTQLCTLNPGSNFGRLRLYELNGDNQPFSVYSRVEAFSGNGFSIEGYPVGHITGTIGFSWVNGLRRQAAAPGYQSNCFIGSMNEAVTVRLRLFNSTGTQLGSTQTYSLSQHQMIRLLDVFSAVGAPAGDYSNVRAQFLENGTGEPGFIAFCTVQNNTSFDADFRIAKDESPADQGQRHVSAGRDGVTLNSLLSLTSGRDDIFQVFWKHPDWARCFLESNSLAEYELRVKNPAGTVVAGGSNIVDTGEFFLGERSTVNDGVNGIWRIEVGSATGGVPSNPYTLTCTTGNGGSDPLRVGTQPDAF